MEPDSQASEQHSTPFTKVEAGLEALFGGEKHSHAHVGHICDHLHPEHITNRYHSFAPETTGEAKWYVDGCSYFWAVSEALERAQESIYILDWWLSPELYLRRPPSNNAKYRLDVMLQAAAERGVAVNVIIYKEVQAALTLDSLHTKRALETLHPNIHVFRHPDHVPTGYDIKSEFKKAFKDLTHFDLAKASHAAIKAIYGVTDDIVLYWAHHEKLLIVDNKICFMGGLDLCFGRWDTNTHPIADVHPGDLDAILFPGQDYNNARIFDFADVGDWSQNQLDRTKNSRMGWSDVSLCLTGAITSSLVNHFVDRWNYLFDAKYSEKNGTKYTAIDTPDTIEHIGKSVNEAVGSLRKRFAQSLRGFSSRKKVAKEDKVRIQLTRSCTRWSSGHRTEHSIANAYVDAIISAKHFLYIENQFFITATSSKQHPVVNKIGAAIVQRIRRANTHGERFKIWVVMPAVPAFAGDLKSSDALGTRAIMKYQYNSICRGGHSILEKLRAAGIQDPSEYIGFYNLRNFDRINTSTTMEMAEAKAGVAYEVARKEHDDLVGAGNFPRGEGTGGKTESYHKYQKGAHESIDKTKDSVAAAYMDGRDELEQFAWDGDSETEMDAFVSEELYIHTKLLIADDRLVICGSANLNDRSQLGTHDSEIAVVIEDGPMVSTTMNGRPYQASRFATSLRRQIFRKHLGLLPHQDPQKPNANWHPVTDAINEYDWGSPGDILVRDPLHANFSNLWSGTAKVNTEIFRRAFHAVPDDTVRTWKDYDEFYSKHFKSPTTNAKSRKEEQTASNKDTTAPDDGVDAEVPATKDKGKAAQLSKEEEKELQQAGQEVQTEETLRTNREVPQSENEEQGGAENKHDRECKTKKDQPEKVEYGHVVRSEFPGGIKELKGWLSRVRGTLVEMPLEFLADVHDIARTGFTLNSLTEEIYT